MRIEIREFLERQPNGDRATSLTTSSRFEVWQILDEHDSDRKKEIKLHTFDQFDARGLFGPSVGSHSETKGKARDYAAKFGCKVSWSQFREKVVPRKKEWVKISG